MSIKANPLVVIGAQKCGTATLMHDLNACKHLNVNLNEKESSPLLMRRGLLFGKENLNKLKSIDNNVVVDISTLYTFLPVHRVPVDEVRELLPDAKFLYLMREPLNRALSHHSHDRVLGLTTQSAESDLHLASSYVANSLYASQLRPWLAYFPEDRFSLIKFEDYITDRQQTIRAICEFSGVPDIGVKNIDPDSVANETANRPRFPPIVAAAIRSSFYQKYIKKRIAGSVRNKLKGGLGKTHDMQTSKISASHAAQLQEVFAIDALMLKTQFTDPPQWHRKQK